MVLILSTRDRRVLNDGGTQALQHESNFLNQICCSFGFSRFRIDRPFKGRQQNHCFQMFTAYRYL